MALQVVEPFDQYGTTITLIQSNPQANFATTTFYSLVAGHISGNALQIQRGALNVLRYLVPTRSFGGISLWFKMNIASQSATQTTGQVIAIFWDGATAQISVAVNHLTGKIEVWRGNLGTLLFTSTNVIPSDTWTHLEFQATIHPTTGSFSVRINRTDVGWVPLQSNQNTRSSAANQITHHGFHSTSGSSSGTIQIDHFVGYDDQGTEFNTWIGDVRLETKFPNANGVLVEWTPVSGFNWDKVNNNPPNDADYVSTPTVGLIDSYTFAPFTGSILAVAKYDRVWKTDAGAGSYESQLKLGASIATGPTVALNTTPTYYNVISSRDPAGNPWTLANVNATELRIRRAA